MKLPSVTSMMQVDWYEQMPLYSKPIMGFASQCI